MFRYGVEVADVGTGDVSFSTPSLADVRRNLEITEIQKPENQTQQLIVEYIYLPEGCDDIKSREDKQNLGMQPDLFFFLAKISTL